MRQPVGSKSTKSKGLTFISGYASIRSIKKRAVVGGLVEFFRTVHCFEFY